MRKLLHGVLVSNYTEEEVRSYVRTLNARVRLIASELNTPCFIMGSFVDGLVTPYSDVDLAYICTGAVDADSRVRIKKGVEQRLISKYQWFDPNKKNGLVDIFPLPARDIGQMDRKIIYGSNLDLEDFIY